MDIIFDISAALRRLFQSLVCTYGQCTLRGGRLLRPLQIRRGHLLSDKRVRVELVTQLQDPEFVNIGRPLLVGRSVGHAAPPNPATYQHTICFELRASS